METLLGLLIPQTLKSGFLKVRVYVNKPHTLAELKGNIGREIANISSDMLERVFDSFSARLEECMAKDGHHLKDVFFKS